MWEMTVSWHNKQFMQTLYTTCTFDDTLLQFTKSVL